MIALEFGAGVVGTAFAAMAVGERPAHLDKAGMAASSGGRSLSEMPTFLPRCRIGRSNLLFRHVWEGDVPLCVGGDAVASS